MMADKSAGGATAAGTDLTGRLDDELVQNVELSAKVCNTIALIGLRQFDRFVLNAAPGDIRVRALERLCHDSVSAKATWEFDPQNNLVRLIHIDGAGEKPQTQLPVEERAEKSMPLHTLLGEFAALNFKENDAKAVLIVNAALLFEDSAAPRTDDFPSLRAIERFARTGPAKRLLILRAARPSDIPNAILSSPRVRTVHLAAASRDVRYRYAMKFGKPLSELCNAPLEDIAKTLSEATEDWTLDLMDALIRMAELQHVSRPSDFEALARAVRIGTTHSPWAGDQIRAAMRTAEDKLTRRVRGQPAAVNAVVSSLRRAVIGLSTAHQGDGSQAPRAVLVLAGPTGTGKTETAKAISELVYGQEQLLRFDCGELREPHSVARLIGAPPGYVGFDRGGELTEGIRAKPNSVVLFDEIEKAHPRLLDTLLGVLDDGRLTSGQGETAYFGQATLIFTSNLGIYEEVADTNGAITRVPRFDYNTPFAEVEQTVRAAIREEFVARLGRPELLGRLGGADSIIVFDFLRDLEGVCRKFVANIAASCQSRHGIDLVVDDGIIRAVVEAYRAKPAALSLGGRGLRPDLDRILTNPLTDYLFDSSNGRGRIIASLADGRAAFRTEARA